MKMTATNVVVVFILTRFRELNRKVANLGGAALFKIDSKVCLDDCHAVFLI